MATHKENLQFGISYGYVRVIQISFHKQTRVPVEISPIDSNNNPTVQ